MAETFSVISLFAALPCLEACRHPSSLSLDPSTMSPCDIRRVQLIRNSSANIGTSKLLEKHAVF